MRIHQLELKAYGPFPGTVTIDFDDLNREGLFLLNGPTGSGKSSILDAICFALYGTTSSGRTDLKSRFADPAVQPRVTLECTIGGARYRIERNPAYERPKKRGEGTITEQAKTLIEKYDAATGQWETDPTITRHKDAGDFMLAVLGLNAQQFNQVMLLPQGQFQRFLLASSSEREQLLKKLFGTYEFEAIQALLTAQAKEAGLRAEQARQELDVLVQRGRRAEQGARMDESYAVLGAEGTRVLLGGEGPERTLDNVLEAPVHLEALATDLGELHRQLTGRSREVAEELTTLSDRRSALAQLRADWDEYTQLTCALSELVSEQDVIDRQAVALEAHQRASSIVPLIVAEERAQTSQRNVQERVQSLRAHAHALATSARDDLTQQAGELPILIRALGLLEGELSAEYAEDMSRELTEWEQMLRGLSRDEQRQNELQKAQEKAQTDLKPLEDTVLEAEQRLSSHQVQVEELDNEYREYENAPVEAEKARADYERAEEAQQRATALVNARQRVQRAREEAQQAEARRVAASERAENLYRQRFDNAAFILAETLVEGQPCSVCGSREHPAPALRAEQGKPVSEEALEQARAQRATAEKAATQALTVLSASEESLMQLQQAGAPEPEQAQDLMLQAQAYLQKTQDALEHRSHLARLLKQAEAQTEKLREELATAQRRHTEHTSTMQARESRLAELETELAPHRQSPSFDQRATGVAQLASSITQLLHATQEEARQAETYKRAKDETAEALSQTGFTDIAQVRASALPDEQAQRLAQTITGHRERVLATQARLESPALIDIAERVKQGETAPDAQDIEVLASQVAHLSEEKDSLIAHITRTASAHEEITQVQRELTKALITSQQLVEEAHLRTELATTANAAPGSDNRLRMTLTTYVLAYQLAEVAQAASEHLEKMTHGRYRLEHSDRAEGRGKSGLGLLVFDAWHNAHRQPATLSGGESFMASLALALGLADVVQQANGGIEIDTLFIDEGFGSLDDETLEEVMSTLDALRERGRVIGLISHVAEMKNRINRHILLQTSPQGSSLVTDTGAS